MRILFSAESFYPFIGGAEISARTLLERLAERNEVYALCVGRENKDFKIGRISVKQRLNPIVRISFPLRHEQLTYPAWLGLCIGNLGWKKSLRGIIAEIKPDVILTQLDFAPSTIDIAKENNVPSFLFVRSYKHICPVGFIKKDPLSCDGNCWTCIPWTSKLQFPFLKVVMKWHKTAIEKADLILANSDYVKRVIKHFLGVESEVVYPFIKLSEFKVGKRNPEYITLIGPSTSKGLKIVLGIAKRMPDKEFLIAGRMGIHNEVIELPNVNFIGWVRPKQIYSRTKILLAPSLRPEPFGRVVVEAMANGIPCIVSNRGALPEVVGDAGIIINNVFDLDEWINAINRLVDDETFFKELSRKSKKRAKKFDFPSQFKRFEKLLKDFI